MATPTPEEILEIFEDLNFPSATKLRAALGKIAMSDDSF